MRALRNRRVIASPAGSSPCTHPTTSTRRALSAPPTTHARIGRPCTERPMIVLWAALGAGAPETGWVVAVAAAAPDKGRAAAQAPAPTSASPSSTKRRRRSLNGLA